MLGNAGCAQSQPGAGITMPRIANIKTRELLRLLRRMQFRQANRDHITFYHEWLPLWTKLSHGNREIDPDLMGDIAIKQLKMNSADEFRDALAGDIPLRYLDPNAPWDGRPLV